MAALGTHRDFDLGQSAHNWLVLGLFDSFERAQHRQNVIGLLVFFDRLHCRVVVFLVAQEHMVKQWTLAWQERAGDFESFGVPKFTFKLSVPLHFWLEVVCTRLEQEAHLCAHAEVRHDQH